MSNFSSPDSSLDSRDSPSVDMDNHNHNNSNIMNNNEHINNHMNHDNSHHHHVNMNKNITSSTSSTSSNLFKQQPMNASISSHFHDSGNFLMYPDHDHDHHDHEHDRDHLPPPDHGIDIEMEMDHKPGGNAMDLLMMGLEAPGSSNAAAALPQFAANMNMSMQSPTLEFQSNLPENINMTPSLHALANGIFDLSSPNTPHLPPLSIDANSQSTNTGNSNNNNNKGFTSSHLSDSYFPPSASTDDMSLPYASISEIPNVPMMPHLGHSAPQELNNLDWNTFYKLIGPNHAPHSSNNNNNMPPLIDRIYPGDANELQTSPDPNDADDKLEHDPFNDSQSQSHDNSNSNSNVGRKRKKMDNDNETITTPSTSVDFHNEVEQCTPAKKRKLSKAASVKPDTNESVSVEETPKKRKRGRPRKHPDKVSIKKEKKETKSKTKSKPRGRPGRKKKNESVSDDEAIDMDYYLSQSGAESYVGIRTEDGEVRVQIPPSKKSDDFPKVKYSVFGNACSDKIEDILQPKKRTRYVRGLSEEEKKTRRREQNRNAAARSRARKNAMISKVIQLHQENMGLRAFVAENITQTKILREEIHRLKGMVMQQQMHHSMVSPHQRTPPLPADIDTKIPPMPPQTSSLFDIINQDSSVFFEEK